MHKKNKAAQQAENVQKHARYVYVDISYQGRKLPK
jgi:hypothetical protein